MLHHIISLVAEHDLRPWRQGLIRLLEVFDISLQDHFLVIRGKSLENWIDQLDIFMQEKVTDAETILAR